MKRGTVETSTGLNAWGRDYVSRMWQHQFKLLNVERWRRLSTETSSSSSGYRDATSVLFMQSELALFTVQQPCWTSSWPFIRLLEYPVPVQSQNATRPLTLRQACLIKCFVLRLGDRFDHISFQSIIKTEWRSGEGNRDRERPCGDVDAETLNLYQFSEAGFVSKLNSFENQWMSPVFTKILRPMAKLSNLFSSHIMMIWQHTSTLSRRVLPLAVSTSGRIVIALLAR